MRSSLLVLTFSAMVPCAAQDTRQALRSELERIHDLDQRDRENIGSYGVGTAGRDSVGRHLQLVDSLNTSRISAILDSAGWLGPDDVGVKASRAIWLVLQHAPLPVQERYLPEMRLAVEEGKAGRADLAYLEDRINMRKGLPQVYGSQVEMKDGKAWLAPIADESRVNELRRSVGLGPLEDYAAQFGIVWSPPEKKERILLMGPKK